MLVLLSCLLQMKEVEGAEGDETRGTECDAFLVLPPGQLLIKNHNAPSSAVAVDRTDEQYACESHIGSIRGTCRVRCFLSTRGIIMCSR